MFTDHTWIVSIGHRSLTQCWVPFHHGKLTSVQRLEIVKLWNKFFVHLEQLTIGKIDSPNVHWIHVYMLFKRNAFDSIAFFSQCTIAYTIKKFQTQFSLLDDRRTASIVECPYFIKNQDSRNIIINGTHCHAMITTYYLLFKPIMSVISGFNKMALLSTQCVKQWTYWEIISVSN